MNEPQSDIFRKLEDAVEQWSAQVSGAQEGLAAQLARARGHLDGAGGGLAGLEGLPGLLEELRDEMRALREQSRAPQPPQDSPPSETLGPVLEAVNALRERLDALRQDLAGLQRDVAGMRGDLTTVPRLVQRLDELRKAVAEESAPTATPSEPARRVPPADWQEVARLRAQLETDPALTGMDPSDLERQAYDNDGGRRRMGEILVAAGVLKPEQLESALTEQERTPSRRLGSILIEEGLAPEEVVARVLAGQLRTRFVRLADETLEKDAVALVSARMARHHTCIPVRVTEDRLILAMANPFDLIAIDDVELASHRRIEAVVATASDIDEAITRTYGNA